jgi:hypothetical protein
MSSKKYNMTVHGVMKWADHELKHVGYLVTVKDPDIQYSYAQSVVNGMLHLRDALFEMVNDPKYAQQKEDLLKTHDNVVRAVKHVIKDFNVDLSDIKRFNTRHVLSDLSYLNSDTQRKTRNTRKTRKRRS